MNLRSRYEKKHKLNQTAIVLIHGFAPIAEKTMADLDRELSLLDYVVIRPSLFDGSNPEDIDPYFWLLRAKKAVKEALSEYGRVIVVGHSMGALVASYLAAAVEGVERVVLLSGPFDMVTFATARTGISSALKLFDDSKRIEVDSKPSFHEGHYRSLLEIYELTRFSPTKIKVPTLLIHGDSDDVVALEASKTAYKMINHEEKELVILHNRNHDINEVKEKDRTIVNLIHGFINNY